MGPPRRVVAFVRELETAVDVAVVGPQRPVLAFSGGLTSLVMAMVARKRSDLRCLVAGVEGSADIAAAKRAKDSFEYRVEVVPLDAARVRTIAAGLAADFPGLTGPQRRELVPLRAVLLRAPETRVLAGLRGTRHSVELGQAAERAGARLPPATCPGRRRVARDGPIRGAASRPPGGVGPRASPIPIRGSGHRRIPASLKVARGASDDDLLRDNQYSRAVRTVQRTSEH